MSRYQIAVSGMGLLFVGMLAILGMGLREMWLGWGATGWPQVTGHVTESNVATEQSRVERKVPGASDQRTTSQLVMLYTPVVKYEYQVAGRAYQSERISISDGILVENRQFAADVAARYPVGAEVAVYFHPSQPELAVLETGISEGAQATTVLGLVFSLMTGGFLAFALSRTGKEVSLALTSGPAKVDVSSLHRQSRMSRKS